VRRGVLLALIGTVHLPSTMPGKVSREMDGVSRVLDALDWHPPSLEPDSGCALGLGVRLGLTGWRRGGVFG